MATIPLDKIGEMHPQAYAELSAYLTARSKLEEEAAKKRDR
jgi:hypothetical protein